MTIALPGYYNRFDAADNYDEILFRAGKGLQSAELNEIQSTQLDRLKRIADAVFRDGAVISGTPPTITGTSVACPLSVIYLRGAVRNVDAGTLTISIIGLVRIGVYLLDAEITEQQDATLRDPAVGTRNYTEPGAGRLRTTATWGREGDGSTGSFYPVYTIINGALLNQGASNIGDNYSEALARYDRESNGNYIVTGLSVTPLGLTAGVNAFSVNHGTGNIFGYKIDKPSSTRLNFTEDPDLELVDAEPDTFTGTTGGSATIQLNRFPVDAILEVIITREKTVSITRGGFSGGQDTLPDVSVLSIQSITQGGTTYVATTDYFLNGDKVDWSPGGSEPASGSTYSITYQYLGAATPSALNLQVGTFTITGAVNNTLVLTDYRWKLPRYDRLCIDREGSFSCVKGISSRFTPVPPATPPNLLSLATIEQKWGLTPSVVNDGIRAIPFDQLERMRSLIVDLFDLVAVERLRNDISSREPSSKRGVFVDPFLDDDLRDQGITQTAAIISGFLVLPVTASVYYAPDANNNQDWTLPYTEEVVLKQELSTGQSLINPYQVFTAVPAIVRLTPAVDQWVNVDTQWSSSLTQNIFQPNTLGSWIGGFRSITDTSTQLLSENRRPAQFLRQIVVQFLVQGFEPGEELTQVLFDGINVTPA